MSDESMSRNDDDGLSIEVADLPDVLAVFPLPGVLLLPGGDLALEIKEPRYRALMDDVLAGERLVGVVQPMRPGDRPGPEDAPLYHTGCLGLIGESEDPDDEDEDEDDEDGAALHITLTGLCRFRIVSELPSQGDYRRVRVDYAGFADDLRQPAGAVPDRARLLAALDTFLEDNGIAADWDGIEEAPDELLVTSFAMACPLEPPEKQALLESPDLTSRAELLTNILEMASYLREAGTASTAH